LSVVCLFSSKVGLYCGEVVDTSQPLLPMGMNTPISMRRDLLGRSIADDGGRMTEGARRS
jgi:hypothetical protein